MVLLVQTHFLFYVIHLACCTMYKAQSSRVLQKMGFSSRPIPTNKLELFLFNLKVRKRYILLERNGSSIPTSSHGTSIE